MLNAIFWRLNTGAPWRDLPERYGPWQTVYHRFNRLRHSGLLDRILARLQLRLDQAGLIDPELFCIDGTNVRAARAAAGAAKKTPRIGLVSSSSRRRAGSPATSRCSPTAGVTSPSNSRRR